MTMTSRLAWPSVSSSEDARDGAQPLHVAIVDEELPYPPTSGKRIRTFNLLTRLAKRHRITYLCHRNADRNEAQQAAAFLERQGIATLVVDRPVPPKSGPLFYGRLAANLFSSLPYSVATHTSRDLRQALEQHAATNRVDVWHCEWTPYAEVMRNLAGPHVVVAHNVESLIWQRYYEFESNPVKRWYIRQQWHKFEHFEQQAYAGATVTVAVSSEDASRIRSEFGGERVAVVENGVDLEYFQPRHDLSETKQILFLGSLDWRPNLDAVQVLLEQVFPAVRAAEPRARLAIVGRNPPDWLTRLVQATPSVELHASVADVRPYLARSAVLAVPLRIGGGSRLKVLEALASRVPVVSTRVGAEGLRLEHGRHLTIVEGVSGMASPLLATLADPESARRQAERGRAVVVEQYGWDRLAVELERAWFQAVQAGARPC